MVASGGGEALSLRQCGDCATRVTLREGLAGTPRRAWMQHRRDQTAAADARAIIVLASIDSTQERTRSPP